MFFCVFYETYEIFFKSIYIFIFVEHFWAIASKKVLSRVLYGELLKMCRTAILRKVCEVLPLLFLRSFF